MAGKVISLSKVFRKKQKKGPGGAPEGKTEEEKEIQLLPEDAAMERTPEQEPARGRVHKTLKMFRKFLHIQCRKTRTSATEDTAEPEFGLSELEAEPDVSPDSAEQSEDSESAVSDDREKADVAPTEDVAITNADTRETQGMAKTDTMPIATVIHVSIMNFFEERDFSSQQQVPAMVKNIHQRLASHVTVDAGLCMNIVRLAEEHPADVVLTLLHCAPTCDRAAAMMWRSIGSSGPAVEKVLPTLLCVMERWPKYSMLTCDGDNKDVFALAATLVLWLIIQVPESQEAMSLYSSRLFVALLLQIVISTQQMPPEEVDYFWRACQKEHRLLSKPNRFAVQAMKVLLCRMQGDNEVLAMERKRGWDTLLCANTQHYAVGMLAREMCHGLIPLCSRIALHLLRLLSREEPPWDLPVLAFLVEALKCMDLSQCDESILDILSRNLWNECGERRHLVVRGFVVLSKDPSMAIRMCCLSQTLLALLGDTDREVIGMALHVFANMFKIDDILISSTTAQMLAEALLPLFNNHNSHVQLLSMHLFCKVMELVVDEGKKPLKRIVNKSLYPLFLYCHDKDRRVVKASRETLHCVAKFLKSRHLEQLLKMQHPSKMTECLLAEDRSRVSALLRQVLPFLESPQESLREAAIRFIALQSQRQDVGPLFSDLENQAHFPEGGEELGACVSKNTQENSQEDTISATGDPSTADVGHVSHGFSPLPAAR